MVRRGRWAAAALALLVACSDDGGDAAPGAPTTAADRPPATLPDAVEPGDGAMVLDGEPSVLTVAACTLEPATDEATNVTTQLAVTATDGTGRTVELSRTSFTADAPTVTDTVVVTEPNGTTIESSRVDADGRLLDLRLENPVGRLIDVDGDLVRAEGVFGAPGARGPGDGDVDGEIVLRCP